VIVNRAEAVNVIQMKQVRCQIQDSGGGGEKRLQKKHLLHQLNPVLLLSSYCCCCSTFRDILFKVWDRILQIRRFDNSLTWMELTYLRRIVGQWFRRRILRNCSTRFCISRSRLLRTYRPVIYKDKEFPLFLNCCLTQQLLDLFKQPVAAVVNFIGWTRD